MVRIVASSAYGSAGVCPGLAANAVENRAACGDANSRSWHVALLAAPHRHVGDRVLNGHGRAKPKMTFRTQLRPAVISANGVRLGWLMVLTREKLAGLQRSGQFDGVQRSAFRARRVCAPEVGLHDPFGGGGPSGPIGGGPPLLLPSTLTFWFTTMAALGGE
jgi:hypothetical protein